MRLHFEAYATGTPAPTVTEEVDEAVAGPLLATPDFSKTEVVLLLQSILERDNRRQERAQLARMKAVRIFNPLHVLVNRISVSDIDGLKIFKLYEHPAIRPQIEVTKTQVMKYQLWLSPSSHSRK